VHAEDPVVC